MAAALAWCILGYFSFVQQFKSVGDFE